MRNENELQNTVDGNGDLMESTESRVTVHPPVDIYEGEDAYRVVADMPGLRSDQFSISLDHEMLIVEAQSDVDGLPPLHYLRKFRVVSGLDPSQVSADYQLGVLTIKLPKPATLKPRKITVSAG